MKNKTILLAILAVALVLVMTACPADSPAGSPGPSSAPPASSEEQFAVYTAMSSDSAYVLTIKDSSGSAASHTVTAGDDYVLQIISLSDGEEKKSSGTVTAVGASLTLTPSGSSTTFTVTVSGENISAISGTIMLEDDTPESAPGSVTPFTPGPSLVGTWIKSDNEFKYVFKTKSYALSHIDDGLNENSGTYITYSKGGKNYLITIATLGYHDEIDEYLPYVNPYEYSISGKTLTLTDSGGPETFTKQ